MINSLPKLNPEQYAQKYAQDNNLSIEQARVELQSQYGEPQAPQAFQQQECGSSNSYANLDIFEKMDILNQLNEKEENETSKNSQAQNPILGFISQLFQAFSQNNNSQNKNNASFANSNNQIQNKQDPDEFAKEYMENYNEQNPNDTITLEEAKAILEEKYGKPEQR